MTREYKVIGLFYPSFYIKDFEKATEFYSQIFGPPQTDNERLKGWRLGNSWLSFFPSDEGGHNPEGNPQNSEFAIQVDTPQEVDALFNAFVAAGARSCWDPEDTWMYEDMRFSCVDDPFGIRVDIICPRIMGEE